MHSSKLYPIFQASVSVFAIDSANNAIQKGYIKQRNVHGFHPRHCPGWFRTTPQYFTKSRTDESLRRQIRGKIPMSHFHDELNYSNLNIQKFGRILWKFSKLNRDKSLNETAIIFMVMDPAEGPNTVSNDRYICGRNYAKHNSLFCHANQPVIKY